MDTRRDVFQAIADPTRRAILLLLATQAMTPNAIAEKFDSSRQAISKHIRILAECQMLHQRQQGREIFYQSNVASMKTVADFVEPFRQLWEERFSRLDQVLENLKGDNSNENNDHG